MMFKKTIDNHREINSTRHLTNYLNVSNTYFISNANDFPPPSGNVINLQNLTNWFILNDIDLGGNRINCLGQVSIHGFSSETSSIYSDLPTGESLITSAYALPLHDITLGCNNAGKILNLNSDGTNGLDFLNVNFGSTTLNCGSIGTITDYSNVVMFNCAILDAFDGLIFDGTIGTIAFNQCLFTNLTTAKSFITLSNTLTITRRFRAIFSSFVVASGRKGIEYLNPTVPTEGFILNTVNFSGGGTYLDGIGDTSNFALIENCIGIKNSSENAGYYMIANATATTIALQSTYYKIAGTTTALATNQKFTHSNNKLTYTGAIQANFYYSVILSLSGGNNQNIDLALYKNGLVETETTISVTTDGNGKFESVKLQCLCSFVQNDYLEVFVKNNTSATNITVSNMNVSVFKI